MFRKGSEDVIGWRLLCRGTGLGAEDGRIGGAFVVWTGWDGRLLLMVGCWGRGLGRDGIELVVFVDGLCVCMCLWDCALVFECVEQLRGVGTLAVRVKRGWSGLNMVFDLRTWRILRQEEDGKGGNEQCVLC